MNRAPLIRSLKVLFPLIVIAAVWLVLTAGDWFMRFYWFRWHEGFISKAPVVTEGAGAVGGLRERVVKPRVGGDLSGFLPLASLRREFEETKEGGVLMSDAGGYIQDPAMYLEEADIIVAGDSYMAFGVPVTNIFFSRLSAKLNRPVINRALPARGPFESIIRLAREHENGAPKPMILVWGFIEREITGESFRRYFARMQASDVTTGTPDSPRPNQFDGLHPDRLASDLPGTSAMAQLGQRAWRIGRYLLFRQLPDEVFIMGGAGHPERLLGYGEALDSLYWSEDRRDLQGAAEVVAAVRDYFVQRNIQLIVMPVPDKEQVYRDLISPSDWPKGQSPRESVLPDFLALLNQKGVNSVDLTGPFREERARGLRLYWRDDTHWNDEGIALASELVYRRISNFHDFFGR